MNSTFDPDKLKNKKKSLVDTIVHQTEKETGKINPKANLDNNQKSKIKNQKSNLFEIAKTLLSFVITLIIGVWFYFYATLSPSNYFHEKFNKQNLTTQLDNITKLYADVQTNLIDTKKSNKLLRLEKFSNQVAQIDLDNPILDYEKPVSKMNIQKNGKNNLFKTINAKGEVVYYSEADIRAMENTKELQTEIVRSQLLKILQNAELLKQESAIVINEKIEKLSKELFAILKLINPLEENFPSAITRERIASSKLITSEILVKVKELNLKNLVRVIQKQAYTVDLTTANKETKQIIESLQSALGRLSYQRASSFEEVLERVKKFDLEKITDPIIYQKITQIISSTKDEGDLIVARTIAENLNPINNVNILKKERIKWTMIVQLVEKITRLGADLERDDPNNLPADLRERDIDPDSKLVEFVSYSCNPDKGGKIEIRGDVFGQDDYENKTFSLLADLIDAFEGSKYFQDVEGYSFSKVKDRDGEYYSPLNLKLKIQDLTIDSSLDVRKVIPVEEDVGDGQVDLKELHDIRFSAEELASEVNSEEFDLLDDLREMLE
jgi:hypothetical protein